MLTRILTACLLTVSSSAVAEMFRPYTVEQLRKFFMENRRCYFAVGLVTKAPICPNEGGCFTGDVWCFEDLVSGHGGISEKRGCMLSAYDPIKNTYRKIDVLSRTANGQVTELTSAKLCEKGGFEDLLRMPMNGYGVASVTVRTQGKRLIETKMMPNGEEVELFAAEEDAHALWRGVKPESGGFMRRLKKAFKGE